ncbi:MAG: hypothetical protein ACHQ7M_03040 [Chloroflexota bacterium]
MEQTLEAPAGSILRRAELMLELWRMGADLPRLGFLQWLVDNGRDPEWQLETPAVGARPKSTRRRPSLSSPAAARPPRTFRPRV